MTDENGLLENLQSLLLLFCALIALRTALQRRGRALTFISTGFALLAVAFLLRELDLRGTDLPAWLIYPTTPKGSAIITLLLWLPYLLYAARHFRFSGQMVACYLRSRHGRSMTVVLALLLIGTAFEERLLPVANYVLFEELFETAGYAWFTWALYRLDAARIRPCA